MGIRTTSAELGAGTETEIQRLTGEFMVPATERRYRTDLLATNGRTYARITIVIAAILPCFALIDLQTLGWSAQWAAMLAARLAASAAVLLAGRRMASRPDTFVGFEGRLIMILAQLAVFACALLACVLRPGDATTNAISVTVLMMVALVVVPCRFREQLTLAVLLEAGLIGVSVWRFRDPVLPLVPLVTNVTVALAWGTLMLSFNNRAHRRQWASTQREAATADRLNEELAVADALRAELQLLARQDPLTSASNRREFLRVSTELLDRRDEMAVSMLLLDVDRFKSINDRFGHAAGDVALIWLVDVVRRALRSEDLLARVGGEEFAVLLPGLDAVDATAMAHRLLVTIAAADPPPELSESLTVSVGVAEVRPGDAVGDLMARADDDMYVAKRSGGNTVGRSVAAGLATSSSR